MKSRLIKVLSSLLTPGGLLVMVVILGFSFLAMVLVPGLELASEVADSSTALKLLGEQQRHPTLIRASLESVHDRLGTHGYVQESLDDLRASTARLDAALHEMTLPRPVNWFALTADTGATGAPIAGKHAAQLLDSWARELAVLNPVLEYHGVPYQDNESTGTNLNESGRRLELDVNAALRTSRHVLPALDTEFSAIAADLQSTNLRSATQLRLVMVSGLIIAVALVALVSVLLSARQRQESSLRQARQQTTDILRTVKDGLFLLDQNLLIGSAYSGALETLFQRKDFAGLAFEDLLKSIVSERTLATAIKFVKILWAERTNEKLVKTINPLGEVEVHLDSGNGKFDTRYLQFDFHRVRVDGEMTHVLVSVSDVTARVDLANELQASQSQAQGQVDTLLGILHIDPAQLTSFLSDSNAAMKMINAVLREPTREEGVFRKKLDTLFRQVHAVKGEAAALGLSSIEARAHAFEDDLRSLREKSSLSGNDFLPLVIKLDDLLTHLQSVSELVSRLSRLHGAQHEVVHTVTAVLQEEKQKQQGGKADSGVEAALQQLTARVARENNKEAALKCTGFDAVPEDYRRAVKDIGIQAVRNAIVHGIESPAVRLAAGKPEKGALRLTFQAAGDAGYKLIVEDDGQGLSPERIKEAAVKKGFITAERAQTLDTKQIFSLLFQPGFSTVETATKDAGRGVGMNLIADLTNQMGGRVSVATSAGKFTRLTMTMPRAVKRADDSEAA
ncbi:MAG: two-component system, chemotaxis family, sensor kinase CheA [Gammaproteobacteria bacterium]|jgi:HPt (histidine-containing phosphotransfer) domain-containing protein/PAS domain-containing protein|nr:two-component system, chemotaxis family, sensor kinase CheA [Gammaproteobacteria bacterium]